ncbi:MAG TPA: TMEM165/GDT1 family protein [Planctomycetota bacterium]|nr:TMEM165/GDT1 family protein [Planctomycetota bacterium]
MIPILFTAYGSVFFSEVVGDKLLYTTGVLATRFRSLPIVLGMSVAFMLKMAVAVIVGEQIAKLQEEHAVIVAAITVISFLGVAYTIWRKPLVMPQSQDKSPATKAAIVSFSAIFFSEWGDEGQIASATVAANFPHAHLFVWAGAVLAMVTKGMLAAFLGTGIRKWFADRVHPKALRYFSVVSLLVLCIVTIVQACFGIK